MIFQTEAIRFHHSTLFLVSHPATKILAKLSENDNNELILATGQILHPQFGLTTKNFGSASPFTAPIQPPTPSDHRRPYLAILHRSQSKINIFSLLRLKGSAWLKYFRKGCYLHELPPLKK